MTGLRVFITDRRLLAFRAVAGKIEHALELETAEPQVKADRSTLRGSLEVRLADGRTAWVNRGSGCGCGSPLKALAPPVSWGGYRGAAAQALEEHAELMQAASEDPGPEEP